jgi:hypothetical protein
MEGRDGPAAIQRMERHDPSTAYVRLFTKRMVGVRSQAFSIPITPHFSSLVSSFVDTLERVKLEVVLLIEPAAFEELQREAGPATESERIDRQLHMGMSLFPCIRVEDMDVSVANLQEVDVPSDNVSLEVQVESAAAVVGNVVSREIDRNFHRPVTESFMSMNRCRVSWRFLLLGEVGRTRPASRVA